MSDSIVNRVTRSGQGTRRKITMMEWPDDDGNPTDLYFGKITISDMRDLAAREGLTAEEGGLKDRFDRNLWLMCKKAELENGDSAFQIGDRFELASRGDFMVIQRVINFMFATAWNDPDSDKTPEENAEEAVATDPS